MTSPPKRRQYLVKRWLQIRYMLMLVGGVLAGGIVYGILLQPVLRQRMELMVVSGGNIFSSQELWFSLYPIVAFSTLALFLVGTLLLYFLLQIFVSHTSHASSRLELYYRELARAGVEDPPEEYRGIPEFRTLAGRTASLVQGYQRKWSAVAAKAEEVHAAAGPLASKSDPFQRLLTLRECEHRAVSLGESCKPRRSRRK